MLKATILGSFRVTRGHPDPANAEAVKIFDLLQRQYAVVMPKGHFDSTRMNRKRGKIEKTKRRK